MVNDSVLIARLRAQAADERKTGDEHHARAEAYERAADMLEGKPVAITAVGKSVATAKAHGAGLAVRAGGKGKPPGAISQRWRDNFAEIIRSVPEPHIFGFNHVQSVVKMRENRDMRVSEIRRLFEGNVKHGYLVQPSRDLYQPTQKIMDLIGLKKHEGPSALTKGPHVGGVAERFIASDSKSDGAGLDSAPVGSNPTTSAPSNADIFAGIDLGSPRTTTPD